MVGYIIVDKLSPFVDKNGILQKCVLRYKTGEPIVFETVDLAKAFIIKGYSTLYEDPVHFEHKFQIEEV